MSSQDAYTELKLLRLKEVLELIPLSRATIYRRIADGTFPKALKIGERARAWKFTDIERYISDSDHR